MVLLSSEIVMLTSSADPIAPPTLEKLILITQPLIKGQYQLQEPAFTLFLFTKKALCLALFAVLDQLKPPKLIFLYPAALSDLIMSQHNVRWNVSNS